MVGPGLVFLSTLSLRRATIGPLMFKVQPRNFYPRSPCGERRYFFNAVQIIIVISIHALLAESDALGLLGWLRVLISIHALLAESDKKLINKSSKLSRFLSTLSLRRATIREPTAARNDKFLSTLSLRRATWLRCWQLAARDISIHALLAESDH